MRIVVQAQSAFGFGVMSNLWGSIHFQDPVLKIAMSWPSGAGAHELRARAERGEFKVRETMGKSGGKEFGVHYAPYHGWYFIHAPFNFCHNVLSILFFQWDNWDLETLNNLHHLCVWYSRFCPKALAFQVLTWQSPSSFFFLFFKPRFYYQK
jgi:hypothetical protein